LAQWIGKGAGTQDSRVSPRREWVVLIAAAAAFCLAFLVEPDWNLKQANLRCEGQPVQVFESMSACSVDLRPGCMCFRPQNPWAPAYWIVLLPSFGIAAALLMRRRILEALSSLAGALAVGGGCALLLVAQRESFDAESWGYGMIFVAALGWIILVVFAVTRLVKHLFISPR